LEVATTTEERLESPITVKTEVADAGTWAKTLAVTVPVEEVNKEFDAVVGELAGMVNLPGFRPGKVPRNVIEKKYGDDLKRQVTANLLQRAMRSAIQNEKLDVVGEPEMDAEKIRAVKGEALAFSIGVEIKPQFELKDYKGLSIEQEETELLPNEISDAVDRIRERFAEVVDAPADHGIADKDVANGVLRVLVEGNEVHKEDDAQLLVSDGHVLGAYAHLGSKYLEGAKAGEKRTVEETLTGTFPKEEFRGKKATLEFEVKSIRMRKMPELNEELAVKVGFKNVEEVNAKVRTSLLERLKDEVEQRTRYGLLDKIIEATPFEVPARLGEMMSRRAAQGQLQYFAKMGLPPEMLTAQLDTLMAESKTQSALDIKRYFILDAICAKEGISIEDDDIDAEIVKLARQQNMRASDLYDKMVENNEIQQLENEVKTRKALDYLVEQADIKIVPRKPVEKDKGHEHADHAPAAVPHGHEHGHSHGDHGHEHGSH
jgi:trigger factor